MGIYELNFEYIEAKCLPQVFIYSIRRILRLFAQYIQPTLHFLCYQESNKENLGRPIRILLLQRYVPLFALFL